MTCLCGQQLAPVLARLGSPLCHDCRDDPEGLAQVLGKRPTPTAEVVSIRWRAARRRSYPGAHGSGPAVAA
jgi:hypothetical protein